MLQVLDAAAVRRWCETGRLALAQARAAIDDLNVFPVPDGDTGTNLLLTWEAVDEAVRAAGDGEAATAAALAQASLMGARGNSGVILSQLLRGLAEVLATPAGPAELARGLARAADLAYAAVATPVEGTLLSVARGSAEAAAGEDLASVVAAALAGAEQALARTPEQLPALRDAGVVDAGGRGWVVLLQALSDVVAGRAAAPEPQLHVPRDRSGLASAREAGSPAYAYEVQYLLRDAPDAAVERLRGVLAGLGDSLVVVGGDGLFNVHVHVNDVGAAVEAGLDAGRPFRITVTLFADQVAAERDLPGDDPDGSREQALPVMNERPAQRAVVAVAAGPGLHRLFREAGAHTVEGGPAANPSTAELLAAVRATGARQVALLPNDGNVRAVADAAARTAGEQALDVRVVPTRSAVQGLAALAVVDPEAAFDDDVAGMSSAAAGTRWGELTRAVRDATTPAGPCRAGDALALLDGEVVVVEADLEAAGRGLLERVLGTVELLTLVRGAATPDGLAERLGEHARGVQPDVEVVVVDGGQPNPPLLLGAE